MRCCAIEYYTTFAEQHSQFVLPLTVKIFSKRPLIRKVPLSKLLHILFNFIWLFLFLIIINITVGLDLIVIYCN